MITLYNNANDIAKYIIGHNDVTHLKLQKMLFFLQCYSIKFLRYPLYSNKIYAWPFGPVVADIYGEYKRYEDRMIPRCNGVLDLPMLNTVPADPPEVMRYIDTIVGQLMPYSALALVAITHRADSPWSKVWNNGQGKGLEIPIELLYEYYTPSSENVQQ